MAEPIAAPSTIRATSNLLIWIKRGEERGLNGKPKDKSKKKHDFLTIINTKLFL
jgi:hypothetical protein